MKRITVNFSNNDQSWGRPILEGTQEWACNDEGEGIFTRHADGWKQHLGTGQTPIFRTPAQLRRYIRKMFNVRDARIIETSW